MNKAIQLGSGLNTAPLLFDVMSKWTYVPSHLYSTFLSPTATPALLKAFVAHQVFGRYAGSAGGLLWSFAHPLANIAVYSFLFQVIFRVRFNETTDGTDSFILFFLTGFFPWLLFSEAVDRGCRSVLDNAVLVTKVAFPSELLPLSTTLAASLLNGVGFFILVGYLTWTRPISFAWLLLPAVLALQILFTAGIALILSTLTVFFRDVHEMVRIGLTIWFYATPVLYPVSFVPEPYRWLVHLNPMTLLVESYRRIFFFSSIPWVSLAAFLAVSFFIYLAGILFFRRAKNAFGDVL